MKSIPYSRSRFAEVLRGGTLPGASARGRSVVALLNTRLDAISKDVAAGERSKGEARRAARDELAAASRQLAAHLAELRARRASFDEVAARVERAARAKLNGLSLVEIERAKRLADDAAAGRRKLDAEAVAAAAEAGDVETLAAAHLAGTGGNVLVAVAASDPSTLRDLRQLVAASDAFADEQSVAAAVAELERMASADETPWALANPTHAARAQLDCANGVRLSEILGTAPPTSPAWPAWLRAVVAVDKAPAEPPPPKDSPAPASAPAPQEVA